MCSVNVPAPCKDPRPATHPSRPARREAIAIRLGLWLALCGCGQDTASQAGGEISPTGLASPAATDAGAARTRPEVFSLTVEGIAVAGGAGAAMVIREDDGAWLEVSSGLSNNGFLTMRLQLPDPQSVVGPHQLVLQSPPDPGALAPLRPEAPTALEASASASIDGQEFFAQGGQAAFEVFADQSLDGSFAIELAPLATPLPGQMARFEPTEDFLLLEGDFSGPWNLSCYSRIIAHPTWVPGGAFCDALRL